LMKALDCETVETTLASVANIFGISPAFLETFLDELETPNWDAEEPSLYPSQVVEKLQGKTGEACSFDATCWFHFTRTLETNRFEDGILPLGESIDLVWQALFSLLERGLSKVEWDSFREHVESDSCSRSGCLYQLKLRNPRLWGPYALLIREFGFRTPELGNHDWLRIPEIVEDICLCFEQRYGSSHLMRRFQENTSPCVVKFVEHRADQANLETALYYLYTMHYGYGWSQYFGNTFDRSGESVPASKICKIEFFPDRS
jgi:hypothetical protein